jgi:hypothetical protein
MKIVKDPYPDEEKSQERFVFDVWSFDRYVSCRFLHTV